MATAKASPQRRTSATSPLPTTWLATEAVRPYVRNPRSCPPEAVELVARSIAEHGFLQPIVVDEGHIVLAGHTRLAAARQLGLARVPVIVARGLSPAKARAYRLMDNRSHEATSWEPGLLAAELEALLGEGLDPALAGFSGEELAALLTPASEGTLGRCDPDEIVAPPKTARTAPGDLWCLGRHRLLCGDATCGEDVARLMAGRRATLMVTDWPYGVGYDGGHHPATRGRDGRRISSAAKTRGWDDYREAGELASLYEASLRCATELALSSRPAIYTFFAMLRAPVVFAAWEAAGLLPHQVIIWRKSRAVLTYADYLYDYEPCLYGWRRGHRPSSARRPPAEARAVWEISSAIEDGQGGLHPTQKPVELVRRPIDFHSRVGELLYEPFCGSGTALIAAEMTGRACNALELSPAFCDAAVTRWQRFTGRSARCEAGDG